MIRFYYDQHQNGDFLCKGIGIKFDPLRKCHILQWFLRRPSIFSAHDQRKANNTVQSVAAPENFSWGAARGQNAYLRGQKSKKLPKIADFSHFFFLTGGKWGRASDWGKCPPCPLDAATEFSIY